MSSNLKLVLKEDIEKLIPQAILFNYDELKAAIGEQLKQYKGRVYLEEQTNEAKADRAALNKFATALNDMRIDLERQYNKPFTAFKDRVNELIGEVKEVSAEIDEGIKKYEAEQDEQKKAAIKEYFDFAVKPYEGFVTFEQAFNKKWLNKTYSEKAIKDDIDAFVTNIGNALTAIKALDSEDESYLITYYFRTLDLASAMTENARLQADRQRVKTLVSDNPKAPESPSITPLSAKKNEFTIRFEVTASAAKLKALKAFLKDNEIEYKAI